MNLGIEVNYDKDFNLEDILNKLKEFKSSYNKYKLTNDYKKIGDKLIEFLKEKSYGKEQ